jgi:hypothetical protein
LHKPTVIPTIFKPAELVEVLELHLPRVAIRFDPDESEAARELRKAMSKQMDESLAQQE